LDTVAGHAPEIFFHAIRTNHETTGAGPTKNLLLRAGRANIFFRPPPCPLGPRLFPTVHFYLPSVFCQPIFYFNPEMPMMAMKIGLKPGIQFYIRQGGGTCIGLFFNTVFWHAVK